MKEIFARLRLLIEWFFAAAPGHHSRRRRFGWLLKPRYFWGVMRLWWDSAGHHLHPLEIIPSIDFDGTEIESGSWGQMIEGKELGGCQSYQGTGEMSVLLDDLQPPD